MKVLFLANIPSPYRVAFFEELGKLCDLTVCFEGRKATDRNEDWGVNKYTFFNAIFMKGLRTKSDQFFCPKIVNVIKQKFDIIILGGYSSPTAMMAIEYMRIKQIPFFLEVDGGLIAQENKVKYAIKKHFISSAAVWFSTGNITTEYLVHYGAQKERIYRYPFSSVRQNEILREPISSEEKIALRKKLNIDGNKVGVSVGQFIPRKGFDILLRAWKNCSKDETLYIIGSEPTEEYLKIQRENNLTNVHFVGFKNPKELRNYYQAADVFVFPTREDIWGLVINEAMANGLPVITTERCVAGKELVKEGENGYIVGVEDAVNLYEKVQEFFNDDDKRDYMSKESLKKIQMYTIENMASVHIEILKMLIKKI